MIDASTCVGNLRALRPVTNHILELRDATAGATAGATKCACDASISLCRKQPTVWSLTMPTVCMNAYVTVGPMNLNPCFLRAWLMALDRSVAAGMSLQALHTIGTHLSYNRTGSM